MGRRRFRRAGMGTAAEWSGAVGVTKAHNPTPTGRDGQAEGVNRRNGRTMAMERRQ